MAGGFSSQWTTMGSNTNSSTDPGTSGGGETGIGTFPSGVSNAQAATGASGTNNQVRNECTVWLVDGDDTYTPHFNWPITGDFTIVLNGALTTLAGDPGNVDVIVEGSLTGGDSTSEWVEMRDLGDWDAGTATVGQFVYDFETYGRMPYMRILLDGDAVDNSAKGFKVNIIMH